MDQHLHAFERAATGTVGLTGLPELTRHKTFALLLHMGVGTKQSLPNWGIGDGCFYE